MNPSEDKDVLAIDLDWGSTGIWILRGEHWLNLDYAPLNLPDWLIARFNFWTEWFNRQSPVSFCMQKKEERHFHAYGLSLAIDLRRVLGEEYEVRFGRSHVIALSSPAMSDHPHLPKQPRRSPRPSLDRQIDFDDPEIG